MWRRAPITPYTPPCFIPHISRRKRYVGNLLLSVFDFRCLSFGDLNVLNIVFFLLRRKVKSVFFIVMLTFCCFVLFLVVCFLSPFVCCAFFAFFSQTVSCSLCVFSLVWVWVFFFLFFRPDEQVAFAKIILNMFGLRFYRCWDGVLDCRVCMMAS